VSERRRRRTAARRRAKANPRTDARASAKAKSKSKTKATRAARRRPSMRTALFVVVLVGLLFAFVYPTRTFLDQRASTNRARAQLELLQAENARMDREAKKLNTDSEIEQLAREKYGLVRPGERAYVVLPAPTTSTAPPSGTTTQPAP
jgi:cell division protein FtsB